MQKILEEKSFVRTEKGGEIKELEEKTKFGSFADSAAK